MNERTDDPGEAREPREAASAVFLGTQAASREYGLVLDAKGIVYERIERDGGGELFVAAADAARASEELERYAAESELRREFPPPMVPFGGAAAGAVAYVVVLLMTAYCAGAGQFGLDWLEAGALDARVGARGEWWRAVTALTLHLDQEHLLGNLLFGIGIGMLAGRMFGPGVAWLGIILAGATANYLDMSISPAWHRAVGASTAVFGALGIVAGYAWRERYALRNQRVYRWAPLVAATCLLALLGAGNEHVDVLGHSLGLAVGLLLGACAARAGLPRARGAAPQTAAGAAVLLLIFGAWWMALHHPS